MGAWPLPAELTALITCLAGPLHGRLAWRLLPLMARALRYVRQCGVGLLGQLYGVRFETKLQMAARLIDWLADWLKYLARPLWLVADGAYARRPVLKRARARGVVVVSRLRQDAALWS